jgi:hypothetical protein
MTLPLTDNMTSRTWSNNFPLGLGTSIGRFSLDAFFISTIHPPSSLIGSEQKRKDTFCVPRDFQYRVVLDGLLAV